MLAPRPLSASPKVNVLQQREQLGHHRPRRRQSVVINHQRARGYGLGHQLRQFLLTHRPHDPASDLFFAIEPQFLLGIGEVEQLVTIDATAPIDAMFLREPAFGFASSSLTTIGIGDGGNDG